MIRAAEARATPRLTVGISREVVSHSYQAVPARWTEDAPTKRLQDEAGAARRRLVGERVPDAVEILRLLAEGSLDDEPLGVKPTSENRVGVLEAAHETILFSMYASTSPAA